MRDNMDFTADINGSSFKKVLRPIPGIAIIKKDQVNIGTPKKIEPADQLQHIHGGSNITPIKADDHIVGFVYECSCGESAQIIFDYATDENAAMLAG